MPGIPGEASLHFDRKSSFNFLSRHINISSISAWSMYNITESRNMNTLLDAAITPATLTALAVSLVLIPVAISIAHRLELLAHPVHRSSHTTPTPQVGGIGIAIGIMAGLLLITKENTIGLYPIAALMTLTAAGVLIGLYDDLRPLGAKGKLIAMFLYCAVGCWVLNSLPKSPLWTDTLNIIIMLFAFGWFFYCSNAYNFMDGTNGFSGSFAVIAIGWMLIGRFGFTDWDFVHASEREFFILAAPILAIAALAILGFLPWNLLPYRTFMGDSGSLPVGLLLAIFALWISDAELIPFIGTLLILAPFCYDVGYTLMRRLIRRENIFEAHRSHLYQRLLIATGWSHPVLLIFHLPYFLALGAAGASVLAYPNVESLIVSGATGIGVTVFYTIAVIQYEKRTENKNGCTR
jgi:UDP-N-acetylmuramyl pentapeptide phosphotransferase/UDP-N-acetylglucosamine-1-phosphate transferase